MTDQPQEPATFVWKPQGMMLERVHGLLVDEAAPRFVLLLDYRRDMRQDRLRTKIDGLVTENTALTCERDLWKDSARQLKAERDRLATALTKIQSTGCQMRGVGGCVGELQCVGCIARAALAEPAVVKSAGPFFPQIDTRLTGCAPAPDVSRIEYWCTGHGKLMGPRCPKCEAEREAPTNTVAP